MSRRQAVHHDQIFHEYTAFADEIVCEPFYGHCTHDSTNKLCTIIHLVVKDRIQAKQDQMHI